MRGLNEYGNGAFIWTSSLHFTYNSINSEISSDPPDELIVNVTLYSPSVEVDNINDLHSLESSFISGQSGWVIPENNMET